MAIATVATRRYQNYVNGRLVDPHAGKTLTVENPATGQVVSEVPDSSAEDAREAIESPTRPSGPGRSVPAIERAGYMHRIARGDPERRRAPRPGPVRGAGQAARPVPRRGQGHGQLLRLHRRVGPPDRGRGHRQRPAGRDGAAASAADRRHRRDRALELPAVRPRPEGRAGAPDRLHDRRQAERDHARTAPSSSPASSPTPRCPPASSTSSAATDRSSARSWPRTRSSAW